jgi:FkbM family methyltransferase
MPTLIERSQQLAVGALRPLVRGARRLLVPPPPPPQLQFCRLDAGPAQGCWLQLPHPTALSAAIISGEYEANCIASLSGLLTPSSTCVDIGGHYGFYTVTLAKLAPQGVVHTYEPVARLAASIEASLRKSQLTQATVHRLAVAATSGEEIFRHASADGGDDSMGYLLGRGVATPEARIQYNRFEQTTVKTITIDELGFDPDFIKIDAEGAESGILRGGMQTLTHKRPRLFIELHGIREALACKELLTGIGYRGFCIEDRGATLASLWVHATDEAALVTLQGQSPCPAELP